MSVAQLVILGFGLVGILDCILVIAIAVTLRARWIADPAHAVQAERTPSASDPKRSPRRAARKSPQRAEAVNPAASAPGTPR